MARPVSAGAAVIGSLNRRAVLSSVSEAVTPTGGRTRTWTAFATVWVSLSPTSTDTVATADQKPVRRQTLRAQARDLASAAVGQRCAFSGRNWWVRAVDRDQPRRGYMTLTLESDLT
jgi:head-tail adaptor